MVAGGKDGGVDIAGELVARDGNVRGLGTAEQLSHVGRVAVKPRIAQKSSHRLYCGLAE